MDEGHGNIFTVYKTTNLLNGQYYIGVHITKDINDEYLGSGVLLRRSVEKYGAKNFKKEIIEVFDNSEKMFELESNIVNANLLKDPLCLNLNLGGSGCWYGANKNANTHSSERQKKRTWFSNTEYRKKNDEKVRAWALEGIKRAHEALKQKRNTGWRSQGFAGKKHNQDYIQHMSRIMREKQSGERNSQFGTMWIHNEELRQTKKIKRDEYDDWVKQGWERGRKLKQS